MAMSVRVRVMLGFLSMLMEQRRSSSGLMFCAMMFRIGRDSCVHERMVVCICERGFDQLSRRRLDI